MEGMQVRLVHDRRGFADGGAVLLAPGGIAVVAADQRVRVLDAMGWPSSSATVSAMSP